MHANSVGLVYVAKKSIWINLCYISNVSVKGMACVCKLQYDMIETKKKKQNNKIRTANIFDLNM